MQRRSEPQPFLDLDSYRQSRAVQSLSPNQYIFNFFYILGYPEDILAGVTLQGSQGQNISIECSFFELENADREGKCRYDYVSVNGAKFCGTKGPEVSAKVLDIVIKTDDSISRRGFKCTIDVPEGSGSTSATTAAATTTAATTDSPSGDRSCGVANRVSRIVGGQETVENEYPWQAALVQKGFSSPFCGGTLITTRFVLTAAHCTAEPVDKPDAIQVLLGEHDTTVSSITDGASRVDVAEIIDHENYNARTFNYDYSLLKLETVIDFSRGDRPSVSAHRRRVRRRGRDRQRLGHHLPGRLTAHRSARRHRPDHDQLRVPTVVRQQRNHQQHALRRRPW